MDTKHIQIRDYDYPLPDERIAKFPLPERDSSKLLIYDKGKISETLFHSLPSLLPEGALMVFNNTRVIQARLHFRKGEAQDGALIEVFLLEPADPVEYQENFARKGSCSWYCLVGNLKKWKEGKLTRTLTVDHSTLTITAERIGTHGTSQRIEFEWATDDPQSSLTFAEVIDAVGELPIPPYLNRKTQESDKTTYQTVYSKIKGSVAAPTAGLHFTKRVLADIDARGIEREEVTLHVGAGTFRPVKSEDIGGHEMHSEHIAVHRRTIERLLAHNGEAIAVGTTSVRTLESLYYMGILASQGKEDLHVPQWMPYEYDNSLSTTEALEALLHYMDEQEEEVLHSSTQIIIAPGYKYHIVKQMITNFHQPQSTLLLLVSAFIGEGWHDVYDYALSHDFRFLSYGDSSMLIP
ncbi:MAG: S-adenosylmethionine:tRNA ribosyltransferase-isomerase [Bacteroidaceae bacterium]|nr:S-adenosylmethionine:tRNA ribosyltransferase-isomerase [Bacteroidaceae bacterium]